MRKPVGGEEAEEVMMMSYLIVAVPLLFFGVVLLVFPGPIKTWADAQPNRNGLSSIAAYRLLGVGCLVAGGVVLYYGR
jgi:hypothetical protein